MGLFMIDEKKLLDSLQYWLDSSMDAKKASMNKNQYEFDRYEGQEWILDTIIDAVKKGYYNHD